MNDDARRRTVLRKARWTITVCAVCSEHVNDCVCEPETRKPEPPVRRVPVVEVRQA